MACLPCSDCSSTTSANYTLPDCINGESCEDIQASNCVIYKGPNLGLLGVNNNARLKDVLIALHKSMMSVGYNFPGLPYSLWFCYTYTLFVTSSQTKTIVEYIDQTGTLQTLTLSPSSLSGIAAVSDDVTFCALDGSPVVVSGTGTLIKGSIVVSKDNVSGNSTTLTMTSTTGIIVGQKVTIYSGIGALATNTVVASIVNSTSITISVAPTVTLNSAVVVFSTVGTACYAHD